MWGVPIQFRDVECGELEGMTLCGVGLRNVCPFFIYILDFKFSDALMTLLEVFDEVK